MPIGYDKPTIAPLYGETAAEPAIGISLVLVPVAVVVAGVGVGVGAGAVLWVEAWVW